MNYKDKLKQFNKVIDDKIEKFLIFILDEYSCTLNYNKINILINLPKFKSKFQNLLADNREFLNKLFYFNRTERFLMDSRREDFLKCIEVFVNNGCDVLKSGVSHLVPMFYTPEPNLNFIHEYMIKNNTRDISKQSNLDDIFFNILQMNDVAFVNLFKNNIDVNMVNSLGENILMVGLRILSDKNPDSGYKYYSNIKWIEKFQLLVSLGLDIEHTNNNNEELVKYISPICDLEVKAHLERYILNNPVNNILSKILQPKKINTIRV